MSNLSTFAEVGLIDARASAGTLIIPNSCDIPGRVITFKDLYGATGNSTIALLTSTGDVFEDGTSYRTLANPYDFITLYAASTNMWSIIGGTQFNSLRVNTISNSALTTSSIVGNVVNAPFVNTSFLYPQTGLTFTNTGPLTTSNLIPVNTTNITIGNTLSNYVQVFAQSTMTRNLVASISPASTITIGASLIPAYSTNVISTISLGNPTNRFFQGFFVSTITSSITTDLVATGTLSTTNIIGFNLLGTTILSTQAIFCSSLQIGPADAILDILGPLRTQDLSTVTCQASTIVANTMTTNRLFGGPLTANVTTTQNLNPFTIGAQIGFGTTVGGLGFYSEGHFVSTFTRVIQPTLDNDGFSNVVFMRGNVSSQNINVSSIFGTLISTNTLTTNNLVGSGQFGRFVFTDTLIPNGGVNIGNAPINSFQQGWFNTTYINTIQPNTASAVGINSTVRVLGTLSTQNQMVSSINLKQYPYVSTIGIPASTFTLSGAAANNITNPIFLYRNVAFPHAGFFNITQSAIFSRTNATANVPQASIFYTPGIYPSTISNVDGYSSLPFLGNANASTFTTLAETLYVSTTQLTRNIIYSDPTGNTYTANLFMSPITINYIPNNTLNPE